MTTAAIFDLNGTLCTNPTWKGLGRYVKLHRHNRRMHYAFMATHMPLYFLHRLKLVDKEWAQAVWADHTAWILRGMNLEQGQHIFNWIADEHLLPSSKPDIVALLREHKARGERVILLSGTFQPLLDIIAARLGADVALGTRIERQNGRYTGRSLLPVCYGQGKALRLRAYLAEEGRDVDLSASSAYADGMFDLPVLDMVGRPVAVHPDEELAALAAQRGWEVKT